MLAVRSIHTYYGDSHVLQGVSLDVQSGEVVTLLGRNGMGKSTTIKSIMGLLSPREGTVTFKGEAINGLKPHLIARKGMGYVPEERRVFPSLSVLENLNLPAMGKVGEGWSLDRVYEYFPILQTRGKNKGFELSGGEQQMLAIARVLRMKTDMLLLDEPSEGLAPLLVQDIGRIVLKIREEKITTLLVEQNALFVSKVADRHYVIANGKIVYHGTNEEFARQSEVKETYLGV